jgi:hypothetical protein
MDDLWQDEGFGGVGAVSHVDDDGWDAGEENVDLTLEDGFDGPDELEDEGWEDDGEE